MNEVRLANPNDIPSLQHLDKWPDELNWQRKIEAEEVIVLEVESKIVGLARYTKLWTTVPFLGLIWIEEAHRRQGHSRRMLEFLLAHLKTSGSVALLSSSQTNELEPQAWHIHMGFHTNGIIENIAKENIGEIVYRLILTD